MTPDPWLGAVLGGRYRLLRALGRGGAGAVYEAEQQGLGRKVAIKLMRTELAADHEHLERFRREARAAAQLGHPHIVHLFDFAEARGSEPAYLVLELVSGRSLLQLLREEAPLAPARAVMLSGQILAALSAAHRAGIVHRDVKPGNVVVEDVPGVGEVAKVLDFGIARVQESEAYQRLTRTGVIVGTPRYMSPEQASGAPVDGRTDLWAMGVVLYAALTARFPFDGSPTDVVLGIMTAPVPPMGRAGIPLALEAAVRRALEKAPDDRHPSAEAMADALRAALVPARTPQSTAQTAAPGWASAAVTSTLTSTLTSRGPAQEATRAALSAPTPTREAVTSFSREAPSIVLPPALAAATPTAAAAAATTPALTRVPVWARWLAALVLLGGLGVLALLLMVVSAWAPGSALPPLPGLPTLGAGGAPTSGTSAIFQEDAVRRATAAGPTARLGLMLGQQVDPSTGAVEVGPGASWAFVFVGSDGRATQVRYAVEQSDYPLVTPFELALSPIDGDVPDSRTILAAATAACPGLLAHDGVVLNLLRLQGQETTLSVTVAGGPTWTGRLLPGRVETIVAYGCQ